MEYKFTRTLFYTNTIDIKSFMVAPKVIKPSYASSDDSVNLSVITNTCLIIRYTGGAKNYGTSYYTMNTKNHFNTVKFFRTILNWWNDPKYSNMFYYTQDGLLEFNYDYKNLSVETDWTSSTNHILQARPIVVADNLGRHEGISISINSKENTAQLSWDNFITMADIVINYNFEIEALILLNSFQLSCTLDRIVTTEENKMGYRINQGSKPDPFKK